MTNRVVLVGRLTKDPVKNGTGEKASVSFTVAVNRTFKNAQGETEADFPRVTVWGKAGENVMKYLKKGSLVSVSGSIRTGSYEKDGVRIYTTDVNADPNGVQFLDTKNSSPGEGQSSPSQPTQQNNNGSSNQPSQVDSDPFAGSQQVEVSDDDLPF